MDILDLLTELVQNSKSRASTSIYVYVNFQKLWIQFIDNGTGLKKSIFDNLGKLHRSHFSDYQDQFLAKAIELTEKVVIETKLSGDETLKKRCFHLGKSIMVGGAEEKSSIKSTHGFSIFFKNIFYNHISLKYNINEDKLKTDLVDWLTALSLINFKISFYLKDVSDSSGNLMFRSKRTDSISSKLQNHLAKCNAKIDTIFVSCQKDRISVDLHIGISSASNNKGFQFIYQNDQPLKCPNTFQLFVVKKLLEIIQKNKRDIAIEDVIYMVNIKTSDAKDHKNEKIVKNCISKCLATCDLAKLLPASDKLVDVVKLVQDSEKETKLEITSISPTNANDRIGKRIFNNSLADNSVPFDNPNYRNKICKNWIESIPQNTATNFKEDFNSKITLKNQAIRDAKKYLNIKENKATGSKNVLSLESKTLKKPKKHLQTGKKPERIAKSLISENISIKKSERSIFDSPKKHLPKSIATKNQLSSHDLAKLKKPKKHLQSGRKPERIAKSLISENISIKKSERSIFDSPKENSPESIAKKCQLPSLNLDKTSLNVDEIKSFESISLSDVAEEPAKDKTFNIDSPANDLASANLSIFHHKLTANRDYKLNVDDLENNHNYQEYDEANDAWNGQQNLMNPQIDEFQTNYFLPFRTSSVSIELDIAEGQQLIESNSNTWPNNPNFPYNLTQNEEANNFTHADSVSNQLDDIQQNFIPIEQTNRNFLHTFPQTEDNQANNFSHLQRNSDSSTQRDVNDGQPFELGLNVWQQNRNFLNYLIDPTINENQTNNSLNLLPTSSVRNQRGITDVQQIANLIRQNARNFSDNFMNPSINESRDNFQQQRTSSVSNQRAVTNGQRIDNPSSNVLHRHNLINPQINETETNNFAQRRTSSVSNQRDGINDQQNVNPSSNFWQQNRHNFMNPSINETHTNNFPRRSTSSVSTQRDGTDGQQIANPIRQSHHNLPHNWINRKYDESQTNYSPQRRTNCVSNQRDFSNGQQNVNPSVNVWQQNRNNLINPRNVETQINNFPQHSTSSVINQRDVSNGQHNFNRTQQNHQLPHNWMIPQINENQRRRSTSSVSNQRDVTNNQQIPNLISQNYHFLDNWTNPQIGETHTNRFPRRRTSSVRSQRDVTNDQQNVYPNVWSNNRHFPQNSETQTNNSVNLQPNSARNQQYPLYQQNHTTQYLTNIQNPHLSPINPVGYQPSQQQNGPPYPYGQQTLHPCPIVRTIDPQLPNITININDNQRQQKR